MKFCQLKLRRKDGRRYDDLYTCLVPVGPRILFVGDWYVCLDGGSPRRRFPTQGAYIHPCFEWFSNHDPKLRTAVGNRGRLKLHCDTLIMQLLQRKENSVYSVRTGRELIAS